MSRFIFSQLALLGCMASQAFALSNVTGWCEIGGRVTVSPAAVASPPVSRSFMQSFPACTVNVFITGSGGTRATLYSNNSGTALGNPFTATTTGFFSFFTADGYVDIQLSGGGLASPYTMGSVNVNDAYFLQSGNGAALRLKGDGISDIYSVKDFGAKGDGTTNDYIAIITAQAAAAVNKRQVFFPAGTYAYSTPIALTDHDTDWMGEPGTVLKYTGTSTTTCLSVDGLGGAGGNLKRFWLSDIAINGNALCTNGFTATRTAGAIFTRLRVTNVAGAGIVCHQCVITQFMMPVVSGHQEAFTTTPTTGILVESGGVGQSGDLVIFMPKIEDIAGVGIDIQSCTNCNIIKGTSEVNQTGIRLKGSSVSTTTIDTVDLESNTTRDIELDGVGLSNTVLNVIATSTANPVLLHNSVFGAQFIGGYLNAVSIDATSSYNSFRDVNFTNITPANQITDLSGGKTTFSGCRDAFTGVWVTDKTPAPTTTLTVASTARSGSISTGQDTTAIFNVLGNYANFNVPGAADDSYQNMAFFKAGSRALNFQIQIKPSATAANQRLKLLFGDVTTDRPIEIGTADMRLLVGGTTDDTFTTIQTNRGYRSTGRSLASLPAATNGTWDWCTNCDPGSIPCSASGAGTGSFAFRQDAKWYCPLGGVPVTVSLLPACNAGAEGSVKAVSDASTNTWGAAISGGGANHVRAYCDGTSWTVMGK